MSESLSQLIFTDYFYYNMYGYYVICTLHIYSIAQILSEINAQHSM